MSVYFRTGPSSAVGFSWPVYLFLILPFQAMWLFVKVLVVGCVLIVAAVVWLAAAAWGEWRRRHPGA